jgi:mono/diheme cytochrome c family protein
MGMGRINACFAAGCCLLFSACQQEMAGQPSYKPLDPSEFFPDGRSARPQIDGTVARGHLRTDYAFYTGRRTRTSSEPARAAALLGAAAAGDWLLALALRSSEDADYVDRFPFAITEEALKRGQERYLIFCVVCHDPLGTGRGKIVERGYTPPPSFHIDRLREAPVGRFFAVITNGYGSMPDYRQQIPPRDRWAVTAYVRALQLSQHFPEKELTPEMRTALQNQERAVQTGEPLP